MDENDNLSHEINTALSSGIYYHEKKYAARFDVYLTSPLDEHISEINAIANTRQAEAGARRRCQRTSDQYTFGGQ